MMEYIAMPYKSVSLYPLDFSGDEKFEGNAYNVSGIH